MKTKLGCCILSIVTLCIAFFSAQAEQPSTLRLLSPIPKKPSVQGIVLLTEDRVRVHEELKEKHYPAKPFVDISTTFPEDINRSTTFASLMYTSSTSEPANGSVLDTPVAFTPMRTLQELEAQAQLNTCPQYPETPKKLVGQEGLLNSLIEVRRKRRQIAIRQLESELDDAMQQWMKEQEQLFGFHAPSSVSASTDPMELIERFSRLHFALKNFQYHRSRR